MCHDLDALEARMLLSGVVGGSIVGGVFEDLNSDGVRQTDEPALSGVIVFLDENGNGLLDGGERQAVTDDAGGYRFEGLADGVYQVAEQLPGGFVRTSPVGVNGEGGGVGGGVWGGLPVGIEHIEEVGQWDDPYEVPRLFSANGRYAAHQSRSVGGANWYDLKTGETVLIGDGVYPAAISGNGQFVLVRNYVQADRAGAYQVWDRVTESLEIVADWPSEFESSDDYEISNDGRLILRVSDDYDYVPEGLFRRNGRVDVLDRGVAGDGGVVRRLEVGDEVLLGLMFGLDVSAVTEYSSITMLVDNVNWSQDGSVVVVSVTGWFKAHDLAETKYTQHAFAFDTATGAMILETGEAGFDTVDATGDRVGGWVMNPDSDSDQYYLAAIWDVATGQKDVLSIGQASIVSVTRFDEQGRYVFLSSRDRNVAAGDSDEASDIFRHDLETGLTQLVSVELPESRGSADATLLGVSGDGNEVFYRLGAWYGLEDTRHIRVRLGSPVDEAMRVVVDLTSGEGVGGEIEDVWGPLLGLTAIPSSINGQISFWGVPSAEVRSAWEEVVIYLDDNRNGVRDAGERVAENGENSNRGEFKFRGVSRGVHQVEVELPASLAYVVRFPERSWGMSEVTVVAGARWGASVSIRFAAPATLGGVVFSDLNQDGVRGANERGLAGVEMYHDANRNGVADVDERRVVTDGDGRYAFDRLLPGDYVVGLVGLPNAGVLTTAVPLGEQVFDVVGIGPRFGEEGHYYFAEPHMSRDGRWVFYGDATRSRIAIHDMWTGAISWVPSLGDFQQIEAISDDGRYAVVITRNGAFNTDNPLPYEYWVYDRVADVAKRIDLVVPEIVSRLEIATDWSISHDGRYVSFESPVSLTADEPDVYESDSDVFVLDRVTNVLERLVIGDVLSMSDPMMTPDGRYVVVTGWVAGEHRYYSPDPQVYRVDRLTGESIMVSGELLAGSASISDDGNRIVFEGDERSKSWFDSEVFVYDVMESSTLQLSDSYWIGSHSAIISGDGSRVVFWGGDQVGLEYAEQYGVHAHVVNADGSGLRRLMGAGAAWYLDMNTIVMDGTGSQILYWTDSNDPQSPGLLGLMLADGPDRMRRGASVRVGGVVELSEIGVGVVLVGLNLATTTFGPGVRVGGAGGELLRAMVVRRYLGVTGLDTLEDLLGRGQRLVLESVVY